MMINTHIDSFNVADLIETIEGRLNEARSVFDELSEYMTIEGFDVDDIRTTMRDAETVTATPSLMETAECLDLLDAIKSHPEWAKLQKNDTRICRKDGAHNFARQLAELRYPGIDFSMWPFECIDWDQARERFARRVPDGVIIIKTDGEDEYVAMTGELLERINN